MQNAVEVRYAGIVVGRSTWVRDWNPAGAFIGFAEPMPTGTALQLRGDGIEQAAAVVEVIESADLALAGMRVEFDPSAGSEPAPPAGSTESAAAATPATEGDSEAAVLRATDASDTEAASTGSGKRRRRRR